MQTCSYCGKENDDGAISCRECATELEAGARSRQAQHPSEPESNKLETVRTARTRYIVAFIPTLLAQSSLLWMEQKDGAVALTIVAALIFAFFFVLAARHVFTLRQTISTGALLCLFSLIPILSLIVAAMCDKDLVKEIATLERLQPPTPTAAQLTASLSATFGPEDSVRSFYVKRTGEAFPFEASLEEIVTGFKSGKFDGDWGVRKATGGEYDWITITDLCRSLTANKT